MVMNQFTRGVERVAVIFVNAYLVDIDPAHRSAGWVLVDTGLPGIGAAQIRRAAARRYGPAVAPRAIILTHGHFDHAGSAHALAHGWKVPVYAHPLELPYLTGRSAYPPADPTVGGALAMMSRTFPRGPINLGSHVQALPADGSVPMLNGWRILPTPGHTPGHVSLFREEDRVLLAGDALATMNQDSWITTVTMSRELCSPPGPMTTDWAAAHDSLRRLALVEPKVVAAGHGLPMSGGNFPEAFRRFAERFSAPSHGRYVPEPARADARGVLSIPPPPPDPTGVVLRGALAGAAAAVVMLAVARRKRSAISGQ